MTSWKILHSESSLGWGGQEKRILLTMEALRRRGHQVQLLCQPDSEISRQAAGEGFPVHHLPLDPWMNPRTLWGVRNLLLREKFDLVDTHSSADSWAVGISAKWLGNGRPKVLRTRHLSTPARGMLVYTRLADFVITTGDSVRRHLIGKGVSSDRILSVPTGVDLEKFLPEESLRQEFRRAIGAGTSTKIIGNVAVLRSWKGHGDFLKAAQILHQRRPDTKFVIAGDGPQRDALSQEIIRQGLSDFVLLLGYRQDVQRVLAGLDIFLFTSYANEGVPQAVAQAQAMGVPVIATSVGGTGELVLDGKTGILVAPRDVPAMVEAIEKLLDDRELASRLAQAAQRHVQENFSLQKMEEATDRVYAQVLGNGVQGPQSTRQLHVALIRQKVSPHGGAESVVHRLAKELVARGADVHVLAHRWDEPMNGVIYHFIPKTRVFSWLGAISFQKNVQRFLAANSFDVVHGFDKTYPVTVYRAGDGSHRAWMQRAAREHSGLKKGLIWADPKNHVLLWLEKKILRHPSLKKVIANSDLVRRELIELYGLPQDLVITIRNGIDVSRCNAPKNLLARQEAKKKWGLPADSTVLIFAGNNFFRKGLRYAMQALAAQSQRNIFLLVAGKDPAEPYQRLARQLAIEQQIRFLGEVSSMETVYRAGDLLILPTLYDPSSNVCLEAMAYGLPVLTTPDNGAAEILSPGQTGWIAETRQMPEALGQALQCDLWKAGRAALEAAGKFSFSNMANDLYDTYLSICENES